LPKAHVEAPLAGSILLAGVLLKLGVYGLIRLFPHLIKEGTRIVLFSIIVGLIGSILVGLICLRQVDLKAMVAYSSVAHMGILVAGVSIGLSLGLLGRVGIIVAHGLVRRGLFALLFIIYVRGHRRSILMIRGSQSVMASTGMWGFLACVFNIGAPPSLNFASEVILILSCIS